jgi:uncharacterized protein (TIGR03086 family)
MSSPVLGDNALWRHDETADAQRQCFRGAGALDAVVDHSARSITGAEFLAMRVFDVTVHAWDLARATGGDERVDEGLAACAPEAITSLERGPRFAVVATGDSSDEDPALMRLLDFSGRRP